MAQALIATSQGYITPCAMDALLLAIAEGVTLDPVTYASLLYVASRRYVLAQADDDATVPAEEDDDDDADVKDEEDDEPPPPPLEEEDDVVVEEQATTPQKKKSKKKKGKRKKKKPTTTTTKPTEEDVAQLENPPPPRRMGIKEAHDEFLDNYMDTCFKVSTVCARRCPNSSPVPDESWNEVCLLRRLGPREFECYDLTICELATVRVEDLCLTDHRVQDESPQASYRFRVEDTVLANVGTDDDEPWEPLWRPATIVALDYMEDDFDKPAPYQALTTTPDGSYSLIYVPEDCDACVRRPSSEDDGPSDPDDNNGGKTSSSS